MSRVPTKPLTPCAAPRRKQRAFTLLELILAVALSATLLSLIGTAISLYLSRVESDRTRVEEAQLARTVLAMITDDIRAATIYQPQDTKAIAELIAASTPFDVDSIDAARKTTTPAGLSGANGASPATSVSGLTNGATGTGGSTSAGSSSSGTSAEESDETLPLGLNGTMEDLYVDVTRLPGQDELFGTVTGYTNAQSPNESMSGGTTTGVAAASGVPPSDLKTVHYFVRSAGGGMPAAFETASPLTSSPTGENGLVRQEIPRVMRVFAEEAGNGDTLDSNAVLIAPEVVKIQFRYFNGSELFDTWEMKEQQKLPLAIEVKLWLKSPQPSNKDLEASEVTADTIESAHEYRQIVYLPMASLQQSGTTSESGSSTESANGTSVPATGAAFDE